MDDKFEMLLDDSNSHQLMLQLYVHSRRMTMEDFLMRVFYIWFKKWEQKIDDLRMGSFVILSVFGLDNFDIYEIYLSAYQYIENNKIKLTSSIYLKDNRKKVISSCFLKVKGFYRTEKHSIAFKNHNKPSEKMLKKLAKNIVKTLEQIKHE